MVKEDPNSEPEYRDELERLRAENVALKEKIKVGSRSPGYSRFRWFVVWVMLVLGCLFALTGALATWLRTSALDTDTFVKTAAPLIRERAVANAVSEKAVGILFERFEIDKKVKEAFPEDIDFLGSPVTGALESLAQKLATEILMSDQFQWLWEKSLRFSHETAVEVLKGEGRVALTRKGDVVLDLRDVLIAVRDRLVEHGIEVLRDVKIPEDAGRIELFNSDQLGIVKVIVDWLNLLGFVLPVLAVVFLVLSVVISTDRRKTIMAVGVGLALALALLLITLNLARSELLGKIQNKDYMDAASIIWSHLESGLVKMSWGLITFGIVLGIGATVTGPYAWAVKLRERVSGLFQGWRDRRKSGGGAAGPVGKFVNAHAWGFRVGGAALGIIVLLLLPNPGALAVLITAVVYLIYLAVIELLR